jgi:hypothetical protein
LNNVPNAPSERKSEPQADELHRTLCDAKSGWRYIRETHGDLYGVGWDRVENRLQEQIEISAARLKAAHAAQQGQVSEIEPKFQAAGEINEGGAALWFTSPGEFPAGTQFYVQRASAAASDGGILPPVKSEKSGTQSEAHPSQPAAEGTPRTDAAVVDWDCSGEDHVNADFARTLERELAEAYTRLEANFYYNTKGERCPCKPGEIPDGIACRDETIKGQDKIIADLRDALAAAARDAERYRWLRENPHPAKGSQHTRSGYVLLQKSDLDAAIDAARAGRVS